MATPPSVVVGTSRSVEREMMTRTAVLVLFAAGLLTACGDGGAARSARTSASPTGTTTAEPTAPAPPTSAFPSSEKPPTPGDADDGRNLRACRDGECEVVVKAGDVLRFDRKVETAPLSVLKAGETFMVGDSTGFVSSIGGGGSIETGSVRIEIGEADGARTAIRISPRR
jgi:hypothetical protein